MHLTRILYTSANTCYSRPKIMPRTKLKQTIYYKTFESPAPILYLILLANTQTNTAATGTTDAIVPKAIGETQVMKERDRADRLVLLIDRGAQ